VRLARALPSATVRPPWREIGRREDGGTVMLDFGLTFPLFVGIVLVVVQLALLVNARLVVSYAAFAAARSAVVWLPEGTEAGQQHAERAAALACLPISHPVPGVGVLAVPPLIPVFIHGEDWWRRVQRGGEKHVYAQLATEVELRDPQGGKDFGPRTPVTATVRHQFFLDVPYADGLFALALGEGFGLLPFVNVEDSYTLLNEGKVETQ
jgi:hypothetical protein